MRVRRKKNGFTLVELLVTIALMLSLLGIAIVSFIKISDSRKEDAYKLVEDQILTAAEQYLESNSYSYEGFADGSTAIITLGTLVENDYLNAVTNPMDGKRLKTCSYIGLVKKGNRMQAKEFKNEINCIDSSNYFTISEPGSPTIEGKFIKNSSEVKVAKAKNGWFNYNILGNDTLAVSITGKSNNGQNSVTVSSCSHENLLCTTYANPQDVPVDSNDDYTYKDVSTYANDTTKLITGYQVESMGKKRNIWMDAKVDTKSPVIVLTKSKEFPVNWSNTYSEEKGGLRVDAAVTDETSKIESITKYHNKDGLLGPDKDGANILVSNNAIYNSNGSEGNAVFDLKNYNDGYKEIKVVACDKAGNCSNDVVKAWKDTTPPTIDITGKKGTYIAASDSADASCTSTSTGYTSNTWKNHGCVTMNVNASDSLSNVTKKFTRSDYVANNNNTEYDVPDNNIAWQRAEDNITWHYIARDEAGNEATKDFIVKLDRTEPTCTVTGGNNAWINATSTTTKRTITARCSDTGGSKCTTSSFSTDYSNNINTTTAGAKGNGNGGSFADNAGNTVNCSANQIVKIDKTSPTCSVTGGNNAWINATSTTKKRTITATCSDTGGSKCTTSSFSTDYSNNINTTTAGAKGNGDGGSFADYAGNTVNCSANQIVKIDKTPPSNYTININETNKVGNNKDTKECTNANYNICYSLTRTGEEGHVTWSSSCNDDLSGVDDDHRFLKWTIYNTNFESSDPNNYYDGVNTASFKRFTNYYNTGKKHKNTDKQKWARCTKEIDACDYSASPWLSVTDYKNRTGYPKNTNYYLNFKNLKFKGDRTYDVTYARKCQDRAGNWSNTTVIQIKVADIVKKQMQ